jgi:hypothetical protein
VVSGGGRKRSGNGRIAVAVVEITVCEARVFGYLVHVGMAVAFRGLICFVFISSLPIVIIFIISSFVVVVEHIVTDTRTAARKEARTRGGRGRVKGILGASGTTVTAYAGAARAA